MTAATAALVITTATAAIATATATAATTMAAATTAFIAVFAAAVAAILAAAILAMLAALTAVLTAAWTIAASTATAAMTTIAAVTVLARTTVLRLSDGRLGRRSGAEQRFQPREETALGLRGGGCGRSWASRTIIATLFVTTLFGAFRALGFARRGVATLVAAGTFVTLRTILAGFARWTEIVALPRLRGDDFRAFGWQDVELGLFRGSGRLGVGLSGFAVEWEQVRLVVRDALRRSSASRRCGAGNGRGRSSGLRDRRGSRGRGGGRSFRLRSGLRGSGREWILIFARRGHDLDRGRLVV